MSVVPPSGWSPRKLNELGFVGRGKSKHRPRNAPLLYGGPYPFVQTGDVKAADLYILHYEQTYSKLGLAQSKLWDPGTLCVTIAANIAETAILKIQACFPDSIVGFVADPDKADVKFVKYYIDTLKLQMQNASRGTTQDNLSLHKLLTFDFYVPPLTTQRKIAAILSAYDDLIEVNTRRIALLEEMARGLYREWFVRFRFPGHEGVRIVESAVGVVPEGWEVARLGDACTIVMGQSPSSEFYNESGQGLPFHQGVTDFGHLFPKDRVFCTVENRLANDGDILFSVRAPVGRINIANKKIVIGRGLSAIRSKDGHQVFVYFQLKHIFQKEDIMGGGTVFKAVTKDDVHGIKLLWPPESLIEDFEQVANPILSSLGNLTATNANLRRTRDLLLPRLVAGEVAVHE
jgi:type I restriction enzyme, S subunit